MPIYEYVCQDCGKLNEVLQKISDPPPAKCDGCGAADKLTKIVSRSTFVLKGGGWYSDLYGTPKKDGSSKPAESKSEPKKESAPSTGATSGGAPPPASSSAKAAAPPAK
jgi:putative FmdB family regulatory protein